MSFMDILYCTVLLWEPFDDVLLSTDIHRRLTMNPEEKEVVVDTFDSQTRLV